MAHLATLSLSFTVICRILCNLAVRLLGLPPRAVPYTAACGKGANVVQATQLAARLEEPLPAISLSPRSPWLAALAVTLTAALRNSVAHITAGKIGSG